MTYALVMIGSSSAYEFKPDYANREYSVLWRSQTVYKRWTTRLHFLPLYKNKAKISRIRALPSHVIWSQILRSSDRGMEALYQGPAHTPADSIGNQ